MRFTKMHGIGNDYVYIDCFREKVDDPAALSILVSDRHKGIGSDGLILIKPSDAADFEMEIYNADGSRAQMCGNGIRCVAKYVYDNGLTDKTRISVVSAGALKLLDLAIVDGKVSKVRVNMGEPVLTPALIPVLRASGEPYWAADGTGRTSGTPALEGSAAADSPALIGEPFAVGDATVLITCVSMGNPHAVVFTEDTSVLKLEDIGPRFENHFRFPERINTEFVTVNDRRNITMRVWERGSGETLACGTGACAASVASILNGYTDRRLTVHLIGGDLDISWDEADNCVYMTGSASTSFSGEFDPAELALSIHTR